MGLFSYIKKGGNFGLIAEVVTNWYIGVCNHPKGKALTLPQKMFLSGILDSINYIKAGNFNIDSVGDCVRRAYNNSEIKSEWDFLFAFIMELEKLIFTADTKADIFTIMTQISEHSSDIRNAMESTLNNQNTRTIAKTAPGVNNFLTDNEFYAMITSFEI